MASFLDLELVMDTNISRASSEISSFEFEAGERCGAAAAVAPRSENAGPESLPHEQVAAGNEDVEARKKPAMRYSSSVASLSLALDSLLSLNHIAAAAPVAVPSRSFRSGQVFAPSLSKKLAGKEKTIAKAAVAEDTSARKALNPSPVVGSVKALAQSPTSELGRQQQKKKAASFISPFPEFHRAVGGHFGEPKSNPAALRRATIVWFRNDLRVHDNEALVKASNDSVSMLPVYCFDPRDYGKSSSGFDKTGPYRAKFLLECVANLRESLRERGSELVVRVGRPEEVLPALARSVGADALYAHQEVAHEEMNAEDKVSAALKEEGVESRFFWGSTLFHIDDLPFKLDEMPSNYGGFREKVQSVEVRGTIPAPRHLKALPIRGSVKVGEIPSLQDLGLNAASAMRPVHGVSDVRPGLSGNGESLGVSVSQQVKEEDKDEKHTTHGRALLVGGEVEALQRLQSFSVEASNLATSNSGEPKKTGESIYGANFSCKISPWLAMGCLSPRRMFEDLKQSTKRVISVSTTANKGASGEDDGMNWLIFELLWRDFFRFITKKFGDGKRINDATPVTACTGNLAMA